MAKIYVVSVGTEYANDHSFAYFTNPQAAQQLVDAINQNPDQVEDGTVRYEVTNGDGPSIQEFDADLPLQHFFLKAPQAPEAPFPQAPDEASLSGIDQMRMEDDHLPPGMASWVNRNCRFARKGK